MHHFTSRVYSLQVHRGKTYQESNLTILSTLFYETRQARQAHQFFEARHFMKHANFLKHAKHAILWSMPSTPILWSTPSTPFHGARQAREHAKHVSTESTRARQTREYSKHVKNTKHASTQARHLADSYNDG